MAKTDKEVAVAESTAALAVTGIDYEADVAYAAKFKAEDVSLPFLRIIQKSSPYHEQGHALFIEGAKPGMLLNTVTKEVFEALTTGVEVIPVDNTVTYDEWVPRDAGGGYVTQHKVETPADVEALYKKTTKGGPRGTTDVFSNGNELVKYQRYVVLIRTKDRGLCAAAIGMKSTELKKARAWNALIEDFKIQRSDGSWVKPAIFACSYRLRLVREEKNGESWYNWTIDAVGKVTNADEYNAARELAKALQAGRVSVNMANLDDTGGDPDGTARPMRSADYAGGQQIDGEEVPF